jgi:hypothetical protein
VRGKERVDLGTQLSVTGTRLNDQLFALFGRALDGTAKDGLDLFPPFRLHCASRVGSSPSWM